MAERGKLRVFKNKGGGEKKLEWSIRNTKLPQDTKRALAGKTESDIDNFSLLWHKAAQFWWDGKEKKEKASFFKTDKGHVILNVQPNYAKVPLTEMQARHKELLASLNQSLWKKLNFSLKTSWRMVVGLGGASVYETSMTLHHIYGIPYIPGSAVKGIIRSYLVQEWLGDRFPKEDLQVLDNLIEVTDWKKFLQSSPEKQMQQLQVGKEEKSRPPGKDLLGSLSQIEYIVRKLQSIFGNQQQQGKVIFMDAYPLETPTLKPDVMNPHYDDYYQGKAPPADYLNPTPIPFLTVEETSFSFSFLTRDLDFEQKTEKKKSLAEWFQEALKHHGIGAKTAVGYGYFE